jgi:uncharacterized protein YbjT (DUF2867 family)
VLVTGGTGLLGRAIVAAFDGEEVYFLRFIHFVVRCVCLTFGVPR